MREYNATNLSDFLDIVNDLKFEWDTDDLWFRGVENTKYELVPTLYRGKFKLDHTEELEIYSDFVRKAKAFIPDYNKLKPFDWYVLMQHYGFPTRLLDWTCGSLIGLYFAIRNTLLVNDRSVYVIDPFELNHLFHKTEEVFCCDEALIKDYKIIYSYLPSESLSEHPVAIEPPYFDKRIVAQKSCFTIHGKNRKALNILVNSNEFNIVKINIPHSDVLEIKQELTSVGITESIIFPDLEGLSRELIFHHVIE